MTDEAKPSPWGMAARRERKREIPAAPRTHWISWIDEEIEIKEREDGPGGAGSLVLRDIRDFLVSLLPPEVLEQNGIARLGLRAIVSDKVPPGEAHFYDSKGNLTGKIIDIGKDPKK